MHNKVGEQISRTAVNGETKKLFRLENAMARMGPPHEGFNPINPPGRDVNDRLVLKEQLTAFYGGHELECVDDRIARRCRHVTPHIPETEAYTPGFIVNSARDANSWIGLQTIV
ncbi:MAG: hypothetical protein NVS3B21_25410 [Acidimicrobiales bacterium]